MKNSYLTLFIALFFCSSFGYCQMSKSALFVGNSYTATNNLPSIISQLASSHGHTFTYESITPGGYMWSVHADNASTMETILNGEYDYLVLQEQSVQLARGMDGFAEYGHTSFPPADQLNHQSKILNQCRKTMLYLTWGRQPGNDLYSFLNSPYGGDYSEMQHHLTENYLDLAESLDAEIAPVGAVWKYVIDNHPEVNLYMGDESHPSLAGTYLAACTFYTSLFYESAAGGWVAPGLTAEVAETIQDAVDEVVLGSLGDWLISATEIPCEVSSLPHNNGDWETTILESNLFSEIQFSSSTHGWVKGRGPALYQTNNAGDSWTAVTFPEGIYPAIQSPISGFDEYSFDVCYTDSDTAWFAVSAEKIDSSSIIIGQFEGDIADYVSYVRVFQTVNGGESWVEASPPRTMHEINGSGFLFSRPAFKDLNIHFDDGMRGSLVCTFGFVNDTIVYTFLTDDGGLSWVLNESVITNTTWRHVTFADRLTAYMSGIKDETQTNEEPQRILKTTDGGSTWNEAALLVNNCCFVPYSSNVYHWFSVFSLLGNDTVWAVNSMYNAATYRSINGGTEWEEMSRIPYIGQAKDLAKVGDGIYFAAISTGVHRLVQMDESTGDWQLEAYFPEALADICVTDQYIYVSGGDGTIHRKALNLLSNSDGDQVPQSNVRVFPNPTTGAVEITGVEVSRRLDVHDLQGRLITSFSTNGSAHIRFSLAGEPPGLYLISIDLEDGGVARLKVVVGN